MSHTLESHASHRLAWAPWALVGFRLAAGPVLLGSLLTIGAGALFVAIFVAAVLSDIFDGIVARRIGAVSARLRQMDSVADVALYLQLSLAAWILHADAIRTIAVPLAGLVAGQSALYVGCLVRYRKPPAYHALSAKAWGLALVTGFLIAFCTANTIAGFAIAIAIGYLNTVEELVMTALLPTWHHDVLTLRAALRLRRAERSGGDEEAHRSRDAVGNSLYSSDARE